MQGVSKKFYDGIPNVTVWLVLRKRLHLKAYKLSIVQGTPLSVNVFVTFDYHCKALLETPVHIV
jgi:hypothetical protein